MIGFLSDEFRLKSLSDVRVRRNVILLSTSLYVYLLLVNNLANLFQETTRERELCSITLDVSLFYLIILDTRLIYFIAMFHFARLNN